RLARPTLFFVAGGTNGYLLVDQNDSGAFGSATDFALVFQNGAAKWMCRYWVCGSANCRSIASSSTRRAGYRSDQSAP
ncbi:MAG: hypothetical protein WCC80_09960, partial [Pseudolabrys sp.]